MNPRVPDIIARLQARTEARKAAGQIPNYRHGKRKQPKTRKSLPCVHLGDATGETRPCQACGGETVQVPLRTCAVYGVCTESRVVKLDDGAPVKCCGAMCPSRQPV